MQILVEDKTIVQTKPAIREKLRSHELLIIEMGKPIHNTAIILSASEIIPGKEGIKYVIVLK